MTEKKLSTAIEEEVWEDPLAVSVHSKENQIMNAYLIDCNYHIGIKSDREWNEKENLTKYKEWLPLSTHVYLPRSPIALAKRLQDQLKSPRKISIENVTFEVLLAFHSNLILCYEDDL